MSLLQKVQRVYREEGLMEVARRGTARVFPYPTLAGRMALWKHMLTEGKRLRKFRNIHTGERCFVIGSGPSIKQQDLTILKDEITFTANWFVHHEHFDELVINYYCASDPNLWQQGDGFPETLYSPLNRNRDIVKFFEHTAKPVCKKGKLFADHQVYFIKLDYCRKVLDNFVSLDPSKLVYHGGTVVIDFCLPIAYYMGFQEVYLLGCDCDYHVDEVPDFSKAYFFDIKKHVVERCEDAIRASGWDTSIFEAYEVMKSAFEKNSRKIYNATIGGKLEVFERVNLEDVVGRRT